MNKKEVVIFVALILLFWPFMILYGAALHALAELVGMP